MWGGEERRKEKRLEKEMPVEYRVSGINIDNYDKFYDAVIKNIGAGGVFMVTKGKIPKYSLLEIRLPLNGEVVLAKAKVIRVLTEHNENYKVAVRFLSFRNASHETIRQFTDKFLTS